MKFNVTVKNLQEARLVKEYQGTGVIIGDDLFATRCPSLIAHQEIATLIKNIKQEGLEVGVCINRIYFDEELAELKKYMLSIKDDVDYFYYNDPACFILGQQLNIEYKLVYDPDTLLTNGYDAQFIQSLNISHSVVSSEITLEEIKEISLMVPGKLEVNLFGYLNMSYSRRPLVKNYCNLINHEFNYLNDDQLYLIEATRKGKMPIIEDAYQTSIYTDYILCGLKEFLPLVSAKVEYIRLDSIFTPFTAVLDFLNCLHRLLNQEDEQQVYLEYIEKYADLPFSTGYMYQKTNLVK